MNGCGGVSVSCGTGSVITGSDVLRSNGMMMMMRNVMERAGFEAGIAKDSMFSYRRALNRA